MSGASAVFIMDLKGKVIISRNYRGEVPMSVTERFVKNVVDEEESKVKPVFHEDGINYMWIQHNNVYLLGVSQRNSNAVLILSFLYRLAGVLTEYFKDVQEESIKDNFVITHELLDEMMDDGYPQTTESKVLKDYITSESHQMTVDQAKAPGTSLTNSVSWRSEGIKHKKNEIFLDVVEKLNLFVNANGQVLRSEILGAVKMKSFLSGMPELKLGLNDKLLLEQNGRNGGTGKGKAVEMEDVKFHQCVRLARFENDRTISFIPPDGEFELMSYRYSFNTRFQTPNVCTQFQYAQFKYSFNTHIHTQTHFRYSFKTHISNNNFNSHISNNSFNTHTSNANFNTQNLHSCPLG